MSINKDILEHLYRKREYFPAKQKTKIRYTRGGGKNGAIILTQGEVDSLHFSLDEILAKKLPSLFPERLDTSSNWIGSSNFPISACVPIISFILEGKIRTADSIAVKSDQYPAILSGIATLDEPLFLQKLEAHLERKLKMAWSDKYRAVAEELKSKIREGVVYLKSL